MRPAVAVILPFHGSAAEGAEALARLGALRLRESDEAVLADNTEDGVVAALPAPPGVRVVVCEVSRSAYAARNIGAEVTTAPWLLFVDADVRLPADLLDRYFDPPPSERAGAVSGGLGGTPGQPGLIPDYIRSRRHLDNADLLAHEHRPMAVTANLLVRRSAFEAIGGFQEQTRAGADADLCWRLQDAGHTLEHRAGAHATHDHRETLRALIAQTRRDGASAPWLAAHHPGYDARVRPAALLRALAGALGWPLRGQPRRGLYKAIDGLWLLAYALGTWESNDAPHATPPARTVLVVDRFPVHGDPLVAAVSALRDRGEPVRVEAARRAPRPAWTDARRLAADFGEDEAALRRRAAALRLALRGRRTRPDVAPAALRLAADADGVRVVAEPAAAVRAQAIVAASGRDVTVAVGGAELLAAR